ncbi:MAG: gamma-glutamyltransferase [Proteobacteria bacterium]|nr:gamma-glutamyltransferase [Pseudomonadota bacterium]
MHPGWLNTASRSGAQTAPRRPVRWLRVAVAALLGLQSGCSAVGGVSDALFGTSGPQAGTPGYVKGFLGGVAADEPRAALAGREVLSSGGNAADAALAVGMTLAVTLPSRAGFGGGGACLAFAAGSKSINQGTPEAILFLPAAPSAASSRADRPAAVPMLARGLFLLHARYGQAPFEGLVVPAEQLARFGTPTSRALARDLAAVSGPLLADPGARAVFSRDGVPLTEGQMLQQPDLGSTLARLRVSGVGDMYQGVLARTIDQQSPVIGGPVTVDDLRNALPKLTAPLVESYGNDKVAFLPPPADGGLAAAAAFRVLARDPNDMGLANARALAVAARYRMGGADADAVLASQNLPAAGLPPLPASTAFATLDRNGNAVVCALTMNNLFGTGRILPTLGFLAAASPAAVPQPLLAAGLAWNDPLKTFRAEVGGSGQAGAALAVAAGMVNTLRSGRPMPAPVPEPGRATVVACGRYLPGEQSECGWATDPREFGLAVGAN